MKIHLYDDDPRQTEADYALNHGSFAAVHINLNKALKKLGCFSEPDLSEWVGCCDGLNINFSFRDKKSFLISVWEYQNTLTYHHLRNLSRNQRLFGLSDQITSLWKKYGIPCETIRGGCDTEFWYPTKKKSKDHFKFLHVNSSNIRSGLDITILAFAKAFSGKPSIQLHIKDTNDSETLRNFISSVKKFYDCNIFYESSRQPMTYLRDLYSESHVTLNMLRMTSFGMPILDSMACGSLCVTGDIEPCNQLATEETAILIQPKSLIPIFENKPYFSSIGLTDCYPNFQCPETPLFYDFDVDTYASKLYDLYVNYDFYKSRTLHGEFYVRENWSWKHSAQKLVKELYGV